MKKNRVAFVSANIGSFDPIFKHADQEITRHFDCDFLYYTEKNLPFPLPNINDRLKSKYVKIQMHRFLPEYDAYVWIDSSVEIISHTFVLHILSLLKDNDVVIPVHPERKNVYHELEYILENIAAGKEYLIKRYANEPLMEEMMFYRNNHMPEDYPLCITRFFARWNNKKVNEAFNDWWNRCIEFVNFDQAMFSYVAWTHDLDLVHLDYFETVDNFMKVHKH